MGKLVCLLLALALASAVKMPRLSARPQLNENGESTVEVPPYKTLWFEEPVDHINRDAGTF
jgi:hypothetical protein